MIHMRLSKWLLAALSVLSCAGAGATSSAPDVAFGSTAMEQMRAARALGAAPTPSPKDCDALGDKKTCKKADKKKVMKWCSGKKQKQKKCRSLCQTKKKKSSLSAICKEACCVLPQPASHTGIVGGLAQFVPIARFCAEEHRARVDGRATARHPHGNTERAVRCVTVKVSAESAGAVASTMFLESLPTRQSGRLAQPDGGAGTPAGRGCHLQGRSAPPSWTTP